MFYQFIAVHPRDELLDGRPGILALFGWKYGVFRHGGQNSVFMRVSQPASLSSLANDVISSGHFGDDRNSFTFLFSRFLSSSFSSILINYSRSGTLFQMRRFVIRNERRFRRKFLNKHPSLEIWKLYCNAKTGYS